MKISHFAVILLLCISPCHAEDLRSFEFDVYGQYPVRGVGYDPVSDEAIAQGEEPQPRTPIKTHMLSRVGPYSCIGKDVVNFFDLKSGEMVATVKVTSRSDRWLFVFVRDPRFNRDPENHLRYLVYPFDDSPSNLPKNGLVFLNISGKELDGFIEKKRMQIGHGETDSIEIQESLPLNLWTRDFRGDRLLPALMKTYNLEPNHRYLIIFFPPVLRGSTDLDVRFLPDKVEGVD